MSTVTYRQLDSNNDPQWGQGTANYVGDADAVALMIRTRLLLFKGEWWADLQEGLPLWQQILGQGAGQQQQQTIALLIQARILATAYVTGISNVETVYNPNTRAFQFSATVQTQFGPVAVTNMPTPPKQTV